MSDWREKEFETQDIAGVSVAAVSEQELVSLMVGDCFRKRAGALDRAVVIADVNGQAISMKQHDAVYAESLATADLVHADGQFIVWLSRMLPGPTIPERTATTDLIHACADAAVENGLSFFLLGGAEEINAGCADTLSERHRGLNIAGRRNGYYSPEEEEAIVAEINESGADVLWVGLGKPKEQVFAMRNRDRLNCAWIVTCGGCFHFVVGDYRRAPVWMQKAGLEWLHRMATGPRYLLRRYLITIPHTLAIVFGHEILGRLKPKRRLDEDRRL